MPKTESLTGSAARGKKSLSNEERVLEYVQSHGAITRNDVLAYACISYGEVLKDWH